MRLLGLPVAGVAGVAAVPNNARCKQLLSQNCHSGPGPGSVASRKCYPDFNSWGKGGSGYCKASKYLEPEPWGRSLGLNILRSPDYSNLGGMSRVQASHHVFGQKPAPGAHWKLVTNMQNSRLRSACLPYPWCSLRFGEGWLTSLKAGMCPCLSPLDGEYGGLDLLS